jgi:acetyl-CoA carboxylase biotin carboxylase subunit
MARMGDKAQAKAEMRTAGVPLVPGVEGTATAAAARAAADELGYPVLLKATAGGGGRGMRLVTAPGQLEDAYAQASNEAMAAFSDGTLYVEKAISRRATSRSRCSATRTAACSRAVSGNARSSGVTRS